MFLTMALIIDTWTSQATAVQSPQTQGALPPAVVVAVGAVGALLLILIVSLIIILSLILWHRKRRGNRKSEIDSNSLSMREDASYSTFERGMRQKVQQQDSNSTELYDQIHLSPFTGQSELISKTETESAEVSIIPNIYSNVDMENSQPQSSSEANKPEDATVIYALVNKKKKKKKSKVASANKDDSTMKENFKIKEKREEEVKAQELPSLEEMYAVVQKKPKKSEEQDETPPPIPPPTVESLYTAVQKKS